MQTPDAEGDELSAAPVAGKVWDEPSCLRRHFLKKCMQQ
jgi:hypothetical protein